jgi:hypothetical protein
MSRRLVLGSLWGLTTAIATGMAWAGVSVVSSSVNATHSPAIPAKAVHAALAAPVRITPSTAAGTSVAPTAASAPGTPAPVKAATATAPSGTHQVAAPRPAVGTSSDSGSALTAAPTPAPAPVLPAAAPSYAPPPALVTRPAATPEQPTPNTGPGSDSSRTGDGQYGSNPPPPPSGSGQGGSSSPTSATFTASGGTATVSCQGSTISLVTATPNDGYALTVQSAGPSIVVVVFDGGRRSSTIRARCSYGRPVNFTDD